MKKKIVKTNSDRLKSMEGRGKSIVESFKKTFDKIKRVNESTVYQGLEELDYNDVYSKINPNDKQTMKIDDYPAEGKNLELWLDVADKALHSTNWEEKKYARHRFLMDDDADVQEYYNKLVKIKTALDKANNGEPLDDFEKRIVRYYRADKGNQNHRIHKMAGDKIDKDYMDNYQGDSLESNEFEIIDNNTKEDGVVKILDNGKAIKQYDDMLVRYNVLINGEKGYFDVHFDGSNGFTYQEKDNQGYTKTAWIRFKDGLPSFVYDIAKKLRGVRK